MDNIPDIVPIQERRYEKIPIDKVKVINSRDRDKDQFEMNVESIDQVGLLKPIRVNDKFVRRSGMYELICGQWYAPVPRTIPPATINRATRTTSDIASSVTFFQTTIVISTPKSASS